MGTVSTAAPSGAERTDPSEHSGLVYKRGEVHTHHTVVGHADTLIRGRWMPLCADKARNNVKNRWLLLNLYLFAAAVVGLIAVLTLYVGKDVRFSVISVTPPPKMVGLGVGWPTFSVQVVDGNRKGIPNIVVAAAMSPINPVPYTVFLPGSIAAQFVREAQCLVTSVVFTAPDAATDQPLCVPQSSPKLLVNNIVTTDDSGVAVFKNMSLAYGAPGEYLLVVSVNDQNMGYLAFTVVMSGAVLAVTPSNITRNTSVMRVGEPTAIDVTVQVYSAHPPLQMAGQIVPLTLQQTVTAPYSSLSQFIPFPIVGNVDKHAVAVGDTAIGVATEFTSLGDGMYEAVLRFPNFTLGSVSSNSSYFGLFVWGVTIPLALGLPVTPATPSGILRQFPALVLPPVTIQSPVATAVAVLALTTVEEMAPVPVTVTVTDANGAPVAHKAVYLASESSASTHAGYGPLFLQGKPLLYSVAMTDSTGVARFPLTTYASFGQVGPQTLTASVDGVVATWGGANGNGSTTQEVMVTSRVFPASCVIKLSAAPWLTQLQALRETVGQPWERFPHVLIRDKNNQTIPGKSFEVRPRDPQVAAVRFSIANGGSGDDGWAVTKSIVTAVVTDTTRPVVFDIYVDSQLIGSFAKLFAPSTAPVGGCAVAEFVGFPQSVVIGVTTVFTLAARTSTGAPAVNQAVGAGVYGGQGIPLPPGVSNLHTVAQTDANGMATFAVTLTGAARGLYVDLGATCLLPGQSLESAIFLSVRFVRRVTSASIALNAAGTAGQLSIDADWSLVSSSMPLKASLRGVWMPSYVGSFYPDVAQPNGAAVAVTSPLQLPTLVVPRGITGLFSFSVTVDDVILQTFTVVVPQIVGYVMILQSALNAPDPILGVASPPPPMGQAFPQQPVILVTDLANNTLSNVIVFAQLGVLQLDGTGASRWINTATNVTDIQVGVLASVNSSLATNKFLVTDLPRPSSMPSDGLGRAAFQGLGIIGAAPNVVFIIRYCAHIDVVNVPDVCVLEPTPVLFSAGNSIVLTASAPGFGEVPVPVTSMSATSGTTLEPFFAQIFDPNGIPLSRALVYAFVSLTEYSLDADAIFTSPTLPLVGPSPMSVSNYLSIGRTTPAGLYKLVVLGPGVRSTVVTIAVSNIAGSITLTEAISPVNALQSDISVSAQVVTASGNPLPGIPVEMSVISEQFICYETGCGSTSSSTLPIISTGSDGKARFSVSFATADTGKYTLRFSFADTDQGLSKARSSIALSLSAFASIFGKAQSQLPTFVGDVVQRSGNASVSWLPSYVDIVVALSQPVAGSSTKGKSLALVGDALSSAFLAGANANANDAAGAANAGSDAAESARQLFSTFLGGGGGGSTSQNTQTTRPFEIVNPVASIVVSNNVPISMVLTDQAILLKSGLIAVPPTSYVIPAETAPQLMLLDSSGQPLGGGFQVDVSIQEGPSCGVTIVLAPGTGVTNNASSVSLAGATLTTTGATGTFHIIATSRGAGRTALAPVTITRAPALTLTQAMKNVAFVVTALFSPALLASVPLSRPVYTVVSLFLIGGIALIAGFVSAQLSTFVAQNDLIKWYVAFVVAVSFLLVLNAFVSAALEGASMLGGKQQFRFMNDEGRGYHGLRYCRWLTNTVVEKQPLSAAEKWKLEADAAEDAAAAVVTAPNAIPTGEEYETGGLGEKLHRRLRYASLGVARTQHDAAETINDALDAELIDTSLRRRKKETARRELQYDESIKDTMLPINYLIVLALTIVVIVAITLVLLSIFFKIQNFLTRIIHALPSSHAATVEIQFVNVLLVRGVQFGVEIATRLFPQYESLNGLVGPIQSLDLIAILGAVRSFLTEISTDLEHAWITGLVVASVGAAATALSLAWVIPGIIRKTRRGGYAGQFDGTLRTTESYVGLHMFHFALLHQLLFWPTVLIFMLVAVKIVRTFLLEQTKVIAAAMAISMVTQMALQYVLVGWFLTDGALLKAPELYSIWHFVGLILGVFTGLAKTGVRFLLGIGLFSALFARLDICVYPAFLSWMDVGHTGFYQMVVADAKNTNPVGLCFSMLLLVEQRLLHLAEEANREGDTDKSVTIPVDSFDYGLLHRSTSAVITNMSRSYLRVLASEQRTISEPWKEPSNSELRLDLWAPKAQRRRQQLIQARFWLLWLLHRNPSLRALRKHSMYVAPATPVMGTCLDIQPGTSCATTEEETSHRVFIPVNSAVRLE